MDHRIVPLIAAGALSACSWLPTRTVTVTEYVDRPVPIAVMPDVPAFLLDPLPVPGPMFVQPANAAAVTALTPDGETALRLWIQGLIGRIAEWEAWAAGE